MTSFPSLSNLVWWLFYLAWYSIGYYLKTNPWSKVAEYQGYLSGWFEQLKQWALDQIAAARAAITAWANSWFSFLESWRQYLAGQVSSAWDWINNTAAGPVYWVNVYAARLQAFISDIYAWLRWFWGNPAYAIAYYLGVAWVWARDFYNNQYQTLRLILGYAWDWLVWFVSAPYQALRYYVGGALDWLQWLYSDPLGVIGYYLGPVWAWLKAVFANQYAWLASVLGAPWGWLLSLWGLNRDALIAFIRDALVFWYNVWSLYRTVLIAFLSDPAGFTLAAVREVFLDWLTQLIADNW